MKLGLPSTLMTAALLIAALGVASPASAEGQVPPQLVGEWKASFDTLTLRPDGSFLRATHRSDLFSYCGPVMTVASVGSVLLNSNQITITPSDGFLDTQNGCNGFHNKSRYVNPANTYVFQLSSDGRRLTLTGPIGSPHSTTNAYSKTR